MVWGAGQAKGREHPIAAEMPSHARALAAGCAALAFAATYARVFILPAVPITIWGDQGGFFNDGSFLLTGALPYRDYFQICPPGTDLFYALLIRVFGLRMWIPNLVICFLAGIVAWQMTWLAVRCLGGWMVAVPAALLMGPVLYSSVDPTHHWFSTIAILAAVITLAEETTTGRVAVTGAWCGVAMCFTQTKGVAAVAGFVAYLWFATSERRWRNCLLVGVVAAALFLAVNAYFIDKAGLKTWVYCLVVYPARYYPVPTMNNWSVMLLESKMHPGRLSWLMYRSMVAGLPATYIALAAVARKQFDLRDIKWRTLLLLGIAGIAMLIAVASAPSLKRLETVSPPAMVLLVWLVRRRGPVGRVTGIAAAATSLALAATLAILPQRGWHAYMTLPGGKCAVTSRTTYEEYRWMQENTRAGDYYFGLPPLLYAFHLKNAAYIPNVEGTAYTRPEHVADAVQALETYRVPVLVLVRTRELLTQQLATSDNRGPFLEYLGQHYQLARSFADGEEAWVRGK